MLISKLAVREYPKTLTTAITAPVIQGRMRFNQAFASKIEEAVQADNVDLCSSSSLLLSTVVK